MASSRGQLVAPIERLDLDLIAVLVAHRGEEPFIGLDVGPPNRAENASLSPAASGHGQRRRLSGISIACSHAEDGIAKPG